MHALRINALIVYTHTTNQIQSWLPPVYYCAPAVAAVSVSVDVSVAAAAAVAAAVVAAALPQKPLALCSLWVY